jgi:hypothetical protein
MSDNEDTRPEEPRPNNVMSVIVFSAVFVLMCAAATWLADFSS